MTNFVFWIKWTPFGHHPLTICDSPASCLTPVCLRTPTDTGNPISHPQGTLFWVPNPSIEQFIKFCVLDQMRLNWIQLSTKLVIFNIHSAQNNCRLQLQQVQHERFEKYTTFEQFHYCSCSTRCMYKSYWMWSGSPYVCDACGACWCLLWVLQVQVGPQCCLVESWMPDSRFSTFLCKGSGFCADKCEPPSLTHKHPPNSLTVL